MRFITPVCLLIVLCFQPTTFGQDIGDRMAQFALQKAIASDGVSVLVEKIELTEGMELTGETEGSEKKYEKRLSSYRTFQRLVYGEGKRRRMDGVVFSMFGGDGVEGGGFESELIHENTGWYWEHQKGIARIGVKTFQVKGGIVPVSTNTGWKHPFDISLCEAAGVRSDAERRLPYLKLILISEETLQDGRSRLTVSMDKGEVLKLTFNKEEEWFTEEIQFWERPLSMEEEIEEAKTGVRKIFTKEMIEKSWKDYKHYATNRTEWKEIEKGRWVPWLTRISSDSLGKKTEYEVRFRDWKFKGEYDKSLLEESSFTPEKILASIDFSAVRDLFDKNK